MDAITLEQLLWDEESHLLDFKSEQYRFEGASDSDKSELLKDILGFCNARRRGVEAYILIGVKEVRGGKSEVIGIDGNNQLEDHSVQQFVNSKTNRAIDFSYEAYAVEDMQVGVIVIREQHRPIYLKKDFGKLKKNAVYVRRGSSTDLGEPAEPDEIALMGVETAKPHSKLTVEFADLERDITIGSEVVIDAEYYETPPDDEIPDYEITRPANESCILGIPESLIRIGAHDVNKDYYREIAEYEFLHRLYRPVRLQIKNDGEVAAKNVRVEIVLNKQSGIDALDASEMPRYPRKQTPLPFSEISEGIHMSRNRVPGEIEISQDKDGCRIEIDCYDLQPGRKVCSGKLYLAVENDGPFEINGLIYADTLPKPPIFKLRILANVRRNFISVVELCR